MVRERLLMGLRFIGRRRNYIHLSEIRVLERHATSSVREWLWHVAFLLIHHLEARTISQFLPYLTNSCWRCYPIRGDEYVEQSLEKRDRNWVCKWSWLEHQCKRRWPDALCRCFMPVPELWKRLEVFILGSFPRNKRKHFRYCRLCRLFTYRRKDEKMKCKSTNSLCCSDTFISKSSKSSRVACPSLTKQRPSRRTTKEEDWQCVD